MGVIVASNNHGFIFKIVDLLNKICKLDLSDFRFGSGSSLGYIAISLDKN